MPDSRRRVDDSFEPPRKWDPAQDHDEAEEAVEPEFFPFLHQSPDFACGFEAGEFWAACEDGVECIEGNFRDDNKGELLRIATQFGYRLVGWGVAVDGFSFARFVRILLLALFTSDLALALDAS